MAYNVVGYRKLSRAIRAFRPDFLYERYSLYTSCGVRAARRHGIPILLEVNAPLALEQEQLGKLAFRRLARRAERSILSRSTRTIAVSTPMKRILVESGVPADHVEFVSNGVDPERFHGRATGADVRRRYGLEGKRVLGFVGWIREWHGLVPLVAAMASWRDVHLLVVGDGPARPDLEETARRVGVANRVHVTGAVARDAMPAHIAAFDVALQPAATPYACPMKVLEYLAMGKPVVACRQENLLGILEEGGSAAFFEPGDYADLVRVAGRLLEDPALLRRMGERARATIFERRLLWSENAARAVRMVAGRGRRVDLREERRTGLLGQARTRPIAR
jgi:glycosyltransferase involved in cell wall biosynthesis